MVKQNEMTLFTAFVVINSVSANKNLIKVSIL